MPAAVRLDAAMEFVRTRGDAGDQAMLKVLLREPLSDEELAALTQFQNPDGGFRVPELKSALSVVGRTAETLTYLAALGAAEFGTAQAAADFLIEAQRPDGTWCEPEALRAASPPPYFSPGSADVTGWETAAAVVALNAMGLPLEFRPALDYLRKHRLEAQPRMFRLESLLLFAGFAKSEGHDSPHAATLRAEVERMPAAELAVFELNWGTFAVAVAGLEASDPIVRGFGESLAAHQGAEGGFGSGPEPNAYETVLALCALEHAGLGKLSRRAPPEPEEPDPANSDRTI